MTKQNKFYHFEDCNTLKEVMDRGKEFYAIPENSELIDNDAPPSRQERLMNKAYFKRTNELVALKKEKEVENENSNI